MLCVFGSRHALCNHWAGLPPTIVRHQQKQPASLLVQYHTHSTARAQRHRAVEARCRQPKSLTIVTQRQDFDQGHIRKSEASADTPSLISRQRIDCGLALLAVWSIGGSAQAAGQPGPQLDIAAELSPRQAELLALVSRPLLAIFIFLMLVRIVLTWYPNIKENKLPWSLATFPTEFFLGPTRRTFPPVGGVDIAPIIWLALFTFFNEILLGPQGILILLQRKIEI